MEYYDIPLIEGLQRKTSPFGAGKGQLRECQNFNLSDKIGVAKKDGDYTQVGNQMNSSKDILGLGTFPRGGSSAGSYEHFAVCEAASDSDIFKYNTGTSQWDVQTGAGAGLTTTARGEFAAMPELDTLFYCNFSDATRSYNGSAWSTSTNVTSAPKARRINAHETRLFLGDCDISGTKYPAHYFFSSSGTDGSLEWDTSNDFYVLPERLMQFAELGEDQLVLTENFVFRADAYDKHMIFHKGTTSAESVVVIGEWCFFANDDGVYVTDAREGQKASSGVDEYFTGLAADFEDDMLAAGLENKYYLYIGDITVPETLSNVILAFDTTQSKWERYSVGVTVKKMMTMTDTAGVKKLYLGDDNGEVFQFHSGNGQDGAAYSGWLEFFPMFLLDGDVFQVNQIEVWGDPLAGTTALYKMDEDEEFESAGELREYYTKLPVQGRGDRIILKLLHNGLSNKPSIHRIRIGFTPTYRKKE